MVVDGHPHGPRAGTTVCQLHMREYHDGAEITVEPWRASAFPIIKDLVVDRSALDRIQQAGGRTTRRWPARRRARRQRSTRRRAG
jgi:succinate dehydrogenase / fumarate reductase iron-sulfur subunit